MGVSELNGVVEDDSVGVVDDLGFVAELDRFAQPPFADRASIDIMQADQPARRLGHRPGQAAACLRHYPLGAPHHGVEVIDRLRQPAFTAPRLARDPAED